MILVINNAMAKIVSQIKSSRVQDFVFSSRKSSCIRCISLQVYNKKHYIASLLLLSKIQLHNLFLVILHFIPNILKRYSS